MNVIWILCKKCMKRMHFSWTEKLVVNALSCVGVIFGKETQKLLYIGVRNKFCAVCE